MSAGTIGTLGDALVEREGSEPLDLALTIYHQIQMRRARGNFPDAVNITVRYTMLKTFIFFPNDLVPPAKMTGD